MKLGIEVLLENKKILNELKKARVGLVCHPASVDQNLRHSFDLLQAKVGLSCAFGPQHGVKGEKQDNMIESEDVLHPQVSIPIYSLYGKVRRPTPQMMQQFDILVYDLQDLGCRIYTFITTLLYVMEECAKFNKKLYVLDRPNPAGREIEGFCLQKGFESFVGAAPMPMRYGLTVGELALYFKDYYSLDLDLQVIKMQGYKPKGPGFGWPTDLVWLNPSPNAASLNMARVYPGTVLVEGTNLSEGRGTTRALEQVGAANLDFAKILDWMQAHAPKSLLRGLLLREAYFEPTFHKFKGELCQGIFLHADFKTYRPATAKPFRTMALLFKAVRTLFPEFPLYRDFAYEYVEDKLAFDVINGGPSLREWIESPKATAAELDQRLLKDEKMWAKVIKKYLLYK